VGAPLAPDTLLLVRGIMQLADRALVPIEQFSLGGLESVRGYRQDLLLSDNGALPSLEVRLPVLASQLECSYSCPFGDVGTTWNSGRSARTLTPGVCWSGFALVHRADASLRVLIGYSLVNVDGFNETWQENGLYFSANLQPLFSKSSVALRKGWMAQPYWR